MKTGRFGMTERGRTAGAAGGEGEVEDGVRGHFRRHAAVFVAVAVFSLCINVLMLTGPLFMLQIYGRVLPSNNVSTLVSLFLLVVLLFAVLGVLDMVRGGILARAGAKLATDFRERLFDAVMRSALRSGGSTASMQPLRELDVVTGFLSGPGITAFYDAPLVPLYLFIIFLFHPVLFWFSLGAAVVLFALAVVNSLASRKPLEARGRAAEEAQRLLSTGVQNVEALHAMGMLSRLREQWRRRHDGVLRHQVRAQGRIGGISAAGRALRLLIQSAVLAIGAWLVIQGEITSGVMIASSVILGRALQPVEQAITNWRSYQNYRQARERVDEALKSAPAQEEMRIVPEVAPRGDLEVRELYVAPPSSRKPYLRNISFRLPAGSLLVLVGHNGSGKTMLARALVGVWQPLGGEVLLDGADLNVWPPERLGRLIGYLPQAVELVEGTIAENIARLDPDATEERIIRAAQQAGAHEAIKKMGGYDVQVGPGGAFLSAGQRQRVALARALYGDPVLVVLDEPVANLDGEGRLDFHKALEGMRRRGQTVVVIDHGDGILRLADYVLVLRDGQIVTGGPREKVMAKRVESGVR